MFALKEAEIVECTIVLESFDKLKKLLRKREALTKIYDKTK